MTYASKLAELDYQLQSDNQDLGFRMLLDLALDSEDIRVFKQCIALIQWQEEHAENKIGFVEKAMDIRNQLALQDFSSPLTEPPIITAEALVKSFGKNKFELGPINISVVAGHLIGLVGENGNGKTTLLRMLAKELSISSGRIQYHFQDKEDDYALRSQLIYIPQRTPKWFGRVKDNLMLTATHYGIKPEENESWVLMMMIRFGLWAFRNHHWNELSSGYKMRFELARTFLRRPKLLLLDEPLANLDILSQQLILEDLRLLGKSLRHPIGIVLSSQQLYEVEKVSDEVVFLKKGKPSSFNTLKKDNQEQSTLVVEMDIDNTREELMQALHPFTINELKLIGSNYYIELQNADAKILMKHLANANIGIKYFRDISKSTRRFFN